MIPNALECIRACWQYILLLPVVGTVSVGTSLSLELQVTASVVHVRFLRQGNESELIARGRGEQFCFECCVVHVARMNAVVHPQHFL